MRNNRFRLCAAGFFALILVVGSGVRAAPLITGINGELISGASVTVLGTGFRDGDFQPFSWDDFESGTDGRTLGEPIIGPTWSTLSVEPLPSYSLTRSHSGSRSAHITWPNYSISAFGWANKGPFRSLYITFWRFMDPQNPDVLPLNFKMMYLYGNGSVSTQTDSPHFMIGAIMPTRSNWQFAVQNYPTINFPWQERRSYFSTNNVWQRWEIYVELESYTSASDGYIEGWLDGVKVFQQGGLNLADSDGRFEDFRLGHMFQGHGSDDHCYYDDVYVSEARARVELGDAPTFNACSVREIQIPTAWSNGQLTVDLHFSQFRQDDIAYLYVVDVNGSVNDGGYPVVIGGSGAVEGDPPQIRITSPTDGDVYETDSQSITLSGWASDDEGLMTVTWINNYSDNGQASTESGDWTDWSANDIILEPGTNYIQIFAIDYDNLATFDDLTVEYTPVDPGPPGEPGQPVLSDSR